MWQIFEYLLWASYGVVLGTVDIMVNRLDLSPALRGIYSRTGAALKSSGHVISTLPGDVQGLWGHVG